MPKWAGKWKGGRYYFDEAGKPVFFIESNRPGIPRVIKLATHDEELAKAKLVDFRADPHAFVRALAPPPEPVAIEPVFITKERVDLYMASIRDTVEDHRKARRKYLHAWADKGVDLRSALTQEGRRGLRATLGEFEGGHNGRTEALNAFARFLVKEGDLPEWRPLVCDHKPEKTRAERVAYDPDELRAAYEKLERQDVKDVFRVRLFAAGMHHTEIEQLAGAKVYRGPMPDLGVGIRVLGDDHPVIRGVLQFRQKKKPRHRVAVTGDVLEAALRLRAKVPDRELVWEKLTPLGIVPSNLRHTFITLAGEVGEWVTYTAKGVPLDLIQQVVGHAIGSKVTQSHYDKLQIPPMVRLPLEWPG